MKFNLRKFLDITDSEPDHHQEREMTEPEFRKIMARSWWLFPVWVVLGIILMEATTAPGTVPFVGDIGLLIGIGFLTTAPAFSWLVEQFKKR